MDLYVLKKLKEQLITFQNSKPNGFTGGEYYQTFKKNILQIVYNVFQKIKAKRIFSNTFYEARVTLIPEPNKSIRRKQYSLISFMNIDVKIINKIAAN